MSPGPPEHELYDTEIKLPIPTWPDAMKSRRLSHVEVPQVVLTLVLRFQTPVSMNFENVFRNRHLLS